MNVPAACGESSWRIASPAAKSAEQFDSGRIPSGVTRRPTMSKREEITPNGDKRYIRRDDKGQIRRSVEEGASLSADARHKARTNAKPGQGDRGDHLAK
jgi:hypothetical protein